MNETKRPPLSHQRILAAALHMADSSESGIAALTMRKLAATLAVEAMALYRYFANKQQLLAAMVAEVFATIAWQPCEGEAPFDQLRSRCIALRASLLKHPWCLRLLDSQTEPSAAALRHYDQVLGVMRQAGFSRQLAADSYALLDSYVYGFVLQEQQLPATEGDQLAELAEAMLAALPKDSYPHLHDMTEHYFLQHSYIHGGGFGGGFERGLADVLAGIERRFHQERR